MNKNILILIIAILFASCQNSVVHVYTLYSEKEIPDSLLETSKQDLIEIISASNSNHSAGKSKNKGDIIHASEYIVNNRYAKYTYKLRINCGSELSGAYFSTIYYTKDEAIKFGYGEIFTYLEYKPLGFEVKRKFDKNGNLK